MRRLALALCFALPFAAAPADAERVARMDVQIEVEPDAGLIVREEILYDFEGEHRHGIYRDVPVRYSRRNGPDYRVALDVLSVENELGRPHGFTTSGRGAYRRIRIGDPNRKITGRVHYYITYRVRLAMLHFDAHDEVYWNATGDEWEVPIDAASVRVTLAGSVARFLDTACFTGPRGATRADCTAEALGSEARFATTGGLPARHGLSIVAALPKGVVREPTSSERLRARLAPWISGWWLLPFGVFAGMYGYWRRAGRDPGQGAAIPVRYEPPEGLSPAEVGTLVDERADLDDVTATILQLAIDGRLEITQLQSTQFLFFEKTDYRLDRTGDPSGLRRHQAKLHQALFSGRESVLVSDLKNEFYKELPEIQESLYEQLSERGGMFVGRPDKLRQRWAIGGGALLPIGVFAMGASPAAGICLLVSGVIVIAFSRNMPRRTRRGRRAYEETLGFREFLERVDHDRLERQGVATREQFERILPYAIVLGAADAWADAFAEIYLEPPDWYHGYDLLDFQPSRFVSDMGRGLDTIGHSLASQPSGSGSSGFSSGGGFSGGGMGGGGGGSW
ncbi:MAG: DUF2207 domain-containing protein [Deltaproteobacteria bacterium]|nr:DUF2207 domain-containing protein [Deltaproteobacteria bacterium]MBW2444875.1 DUF2207 domain-containing protein [Deltaproteobacteria bacterium]